MTATHERRDIAGAVPTATGRSVSGYAALFHVRSSNLGSPSAPLFEIIMPGAFDRVLNDDVRALVNHDSSLLLARSKGGRGSLRLTVDAKGLRYHFEAPNTQAGNDLLESIKRGDLDQSSYSFTIAAGGDSYATEGRSTIRTITRFGALYDVSPVTYPATSETSVTARNRVLPTGTGDRGQGYWKRYSAKLAKNA